MESEGVKRQPVKVDPDRSWQGGECRVCGAPATGRLELYVIELAASAEEREQTRIVGEAYRHADKDNCVYPPELARAMRG